MTGPYAGDNTRSLLAVILLLAAGVSIAAIAVGLSEKPDVATIGVAVTSEEVAALNGTAGFATNAETASAGSTSADPASSTAGTTLDSGTTADSNTTATDLTDEAGQVGAAVPGDATTGTGDASIAGTSNAVTTDESLETDENGDAIDVVVATPTPLPTLVPTPTPQVAAAVEPTPVPDEGGDALDSLNLPAQIAAGTVGGEFFTRADEDEGATVATNQVSLTLNEDGTGSFIGTLEILLIDGTQISLEMSGPIRWSAIDDPQVAAELTGTYRRDSLDDAEDVESTTAELTITSLGSGSGSLCAPTCFGFRFPAQTGF